MKGHIDKGARRWLCGATLVALLCCAATASGAPVDRVTSLTTRGTANAPASFQWASANGTRVVFTTDESLVPQDIDGVLDIYERTSSGSIRLLSGGSTTNEPTFVGASSDGSRVWFTTAESLLPLQDFGGSVDIYERTSGGLRLITEGGSGSGNVFLGATPSGSRVWFSTSDSLVTDDGDNAVDVYERSSTGALRLVSSSPGNANINAIFDGASDNGDRVWFHTTESLIPSLDGDGQTDIYESRPGAPLRLVTPATAGPVQFAAGSSDGSRVVFVTAEPLSTIDIDSTSDVYERTSTGALRLLSGGIDNAPASFAGANSTAHRVWFTTSERLLQGDSDSTRDIYERSASGALRLISARSGNVPATFVGATPGGSRVWFTTAERITGADTDALVDVYERSAVGSLRLISGGTPLSDAVFMGGSDDGSRVWFSSPERIDIADTDTANDVYERSPDGAIRLISHGSEDLAAAFRGATADGSRVWFASVEALSTSDLDAAADVYEARAVIRLLARPTIRGFVSRGSRLSCTTRVLNAAQVRYLWRRNGRAVTRAPRYLITRRDSGRRITCHVTIIGPTGDTLTTASRPRGIPRTFVIPRTRGLTVKGAAQQLGNRGATLRLVRIAGRGVKRGYVLGTRPRLGTRHPNGTQVVIYARR